MKNLSMKFCFVIWILVFLSVSNSCGITIHDAVTHRASLLFPSLNPSSHHLEIVEMTNKYIDFFQAGSFFPDFGYGCFGNNDASEASHWPHFLFEAVKTFQNEFGSNPSNYSIKAKQILVFLIGTLSHSVSDIAWHGLDVPVGFINGIFLIIIYVPA